MSEVVNNSIERGFFDNEIVALSLKLLSDERGEIALDAPCILVVEDHQPNILVITTYLEFFGYQYEVATSGEEALSKMAQKHYAVVLMDVQMHGMSGVETTQAIRKIEKDRESKTHIIGLTAHAMTGDKERCIASGMDDYISKPFNPDTLEDKLNAAAPLIPLV